MSETIKFSAWRDECSVEGCLEGAGGFFNYRCHFHEALHLARELPPERIERLRVQLEELQPLTDEQKAERLRKSRLSSVTYSAESLARSEQYAREAGASEAQIEAAKEEALAEVFA